jgi:probable addiction module antidote protein
MTFRDFNEDLLESLRDPKEAAAYLQAALVENDPDTLLTALRTLAKVKGGLSMLAQKTGLHRVHLYRMLAKGGNPSFKNTLSILQALGVRICFEQVRKAPGRNASRRHSTPAMV